MGSVTVIGCVQVDLLVGPVDDLPPAGTSLFVDELSLRAGGAGANVALALVELGVPTRLIGCVGDDHLGDWLLARLSEAGLEGEVHRVPDGTTGVTLAFEGSGRDRTFLTYLGVNASWGASMIPGDALAADSLMLCDYFCAPALQGEPARDLLRSARAAGARTFFDTAWDPGGFPAATREELRGLLPLVDVFLPNHAEALALAGEPGSLEQAVRRLRSLSGGWVVAKRGSEGCFAAGPGGEELSIPAPAIEVGDSTGAGDAFNAGLIAALADGAGWPDALIAATGFASTVVARPSSERYGQPARGRTLEGERRGW
jgi:sugar/nucleoside kinase (ribokinase family)